MDSSSSGGGRARRRSGGSSSWGSHGDDGDPFYIPAKGAPVERLKKWRVSSSTPPAPAPPSFVVPAM
jgi:Ca2+-transporting ATPase